MSISQDEKRRYKLIKNEDVRILELIHELELVDNLDGNEKFLLQFLRTQLEEDWRTPCLEVLDELKKQVNSEPIKRWNKMKQICKKWWKPNK